jgi:hypothetical protein
MGEIAAPLLAAHLRDKPAAEERRRIEALLRESRVWKPKELQMLRVSICIPN